LYRRGRLSVCDALDLAHASAAVAPDDPHWMASRIQAADMQIPKFPVSGAALRARGVPAGKALGDSLRRIQAAWIAAGFPEDAGQVMTIIDGALTPEM
jgi:poly(A) polymerase